MPAAPLTATHHQDHERLRLAAHFMHPNFLATKNTLHDLGSGKSVIRKYRVDISEPVRDSEKRYRADFFTVAEERS